MGEGVPEAGPMSPAAKSSARRDVRWQYFFPFCCAGEASVNNFSQAIIRDD